MSKLNNAVLISDMKTRMRGWRSPALITIFLVFLSGILALLLASIIGLSNISVNALSAAQIGKQLFSYMSIVLFAMVILTVPSMTSGMISGERERQTFDLLLCTPMSAFAIVWGKLLSSMSFFLLLLIASLPVMAVIFLFGGLEISYTLALYAFLIVCALACGSLGVFFSGLCKKTSIAILLSYFCILFFGIGTAVAGVVHTRLWNNAMSAMYPYGYTETFLSPWLAINPAAGLAYIVGLQTESFTMFSNILGGYGSINTVNGFFNPAITSALFIVMIAIILLIASSIIIKPINKLSFSGKKWKRKS